MRVKGGKGFLNFFFLALSPFLSRFSLPLMEVIYYMQMTRRVEF